MNLCGGLANISEPELVFQIQDAEYDVTPSSRRKKPSSSAAPISDNSSSTHRRSSSRGRERSTTTTTTSTMLNPVSKDDIKKIQYRQQRPRPLVGGMKSSSILMKKLDSGFNVVSF